MILDLKKPNTYINDGVDFDEKRAKVTIKHHYKGTVIIQNIEGKHPLDSIVVGSKADVEIIAVSKAKKSLDTLRIIKLKKESKCRYNFVSFNQEKSIGNTRFIVEENATLSVAVFDWDNASNRNEYTCELQSPGAQVVFNLAMLAGNQYKKSIQITTINRAMNTLATMNNYAVAYGKSAIEICGIGRVNRGAIHASNQQQSDILVIGDDAQATSRPLLFIDENEIEAGHASSIGKMDEEALFYMCSRGLDESTAKRFIIYGKLQPVLNQISDKKIKAKMLKYIGGVI